MDDYAPSGVGIGHNSEDTKITIEVRLFNSLTGFDSGNGAVQRLPLPLDGCLGDVIAHFSIPEKKVFLALVNGRDVTPQLNGRLPLDRSLNDGDIVALSGPVPYNWGYGAPVV